MTWLAGTIETFGGQRPGRRRRMALSVADEEDLVLGVRPRVVEGAGHDLGRAVVAAHRVDGDADAAAR